MKLIRSALASVVFAGLMASALPTQAEENKTPAPAAAPAAETKKPAGEPPPDLETIIPELNLDNVSLDDALEMLQSAVPHFKAVVMRTPDVPEGAPRFQMHLKRVSLEQILHLFQVAGPGMEMTTIEGAGGVVYCFQIQSGAGYVGGNAGLPVQKMVRVYSLAERVAGLVSTRPDVPKDRGTAAKESLNQILSLIKASVALYDDKAEAPIMQIHEETQTLIVKGTAEQHAALESVLAALPRQEIPGLVNVTLQNAEKEARRQAQLLAQTQAELEKARQQLAERDKALEARTEEAERAKVRADEIEKIRKEFAEEKEIAEAEAKKRAEQKSESGK